MYKGFDIELTRRFRPFRMPVFQLGGVRSKSMFDHYLEKGRERFECQKKTISATLSDFIRGDGVIDGCKMMKEWFPQIKADIFLSHSHADESLAIAFAEWLHNEFGLETFIDSTVWGYADHLLKEIDNAYCCKPGSRTYDYALRNRTTAYVHMLLATSLTKMMDKCECLMFLNTPNSIIPDPKRQETSSPWIYYELKQSMVLRKRMLRSRTFSEGGKVKLNEDFNVALPASTNHLAKLSPENLLDWAGYFYRSEQRLKSPQYALDLIYSKENNNL